MDYSKMAAIEAALKNIKGTLDKFTDDDIVEGLKSSSSPDGGSVEVEIGKPEITGRKSKDGGVEVEIKKPVELSRKPDGGVEVEMGEVKIEGRKPNPVEMLKKAPEMLMEKVKPTNELEKLNEAARKAADAGVKDMVLSDEEKRAIEDLLKRMRNKGQ